MKTTDPQFRSMIEEIQSFIGQRVGREWAELFGSAVLVTIPRGSEDLDLDVTGWVNPLEDDIEAGDLVPQCFLHLAVTMLVTMDVTPAQLHGVVMQAAVKSGKALVIEGNDPFDGMVQN